MLRQTLTWKKSCVVSWSRLMTVAAVNKIEVLPYLTFTNHHDTTA